MPSGGVDGYPRRMPFATSLRLGRRATAALSSLVCVALFAGCGDDPRPRAEGPSVVLLVVDTLRADRLGALGNDPSPSPAMDAMAREGLHFTRAYAQSSWTRPSFASFLTGRAPRSTGIHREVGDALHPRFTTLAEHLQAAGYTTLGATANPNVNAVFGFAQGFDRYLDSEVVFGWMDAAPGQEVAGDKPIQSADEILGSLLDLVGDGGLGPYYLQADLMEVHEYHGLADPARDLMGLSDAERTRRYDASIAEVDAALARFVERLRAIPGQEDALVIVTSDHGEGLGDHPGVQGAVGHGFVVYASQAHVPLLMDDGPGTRIESKTVEAPVRLLDLVPTVLELCGLEVPAGLDGRSLQPLVRGEEDPAVRPRPVVVETRFRGSDKLAWFDADWRLVVNRDGHPGTAPLELFPAAATENGAANSLATTDPERAEALARRLADWERLNPPAAAWTPEGGIPEDVQKQLKGVGY